jgi:hypothetical protein
MKHAEYELQKQIARYISIEYPDVDFLSDTVAFLKLSKGQARRNSAIQKKGFRCTDLLILEPNKGYSGLFIELKTTSPFKKNGELKSQKVTKTTTIGKTKVVVSEYDHLQEQQKSIDKLNKKGYLAMFSWGFEMTKEVIDNYLKP